MPALSAVAICLITLSHNPMGWLARATVAPLRVNYHREHHLMAGVPYFNLPVMHHMLLAKGVI